MKRLLKILLIIVLIFIGYPLIKKRTESKEYHIRFHVFKSEEFSNPINRYFRLIPQQYLGKYELTMIADSVDYQIYRVDDLIYGVPKHSYLIYRTDRNKIIDLMSHQLVIEAINDGLIKDNEIDKYYDFVINKKAFNQIYRYSDKRLKQLAYSNLFRTSFDSTTFRLIASISDIDSVLKYRPTSEGTILKFMIDSITGQPVESIKDFSFLQDSILNENAMYYWYFDKGLIKFEFNYDNSGDIISIDYKDLGYLGNEIIHL